MVTARRVVITVVLAVAFGALVLGFRLGTGGREDVAALEEAVEGQLPAPGSSGLQQESIEIDLAAGWTGTLSVNGVDIPADELNCLDDCGVPLCGPSETPRAGGEGCRVPNDPQNRVYFRPGAGKEIEELPTGDILVVARIRRLSERPEDARPVSWSFRVSA